MCLQITNVKPNDWDLDQLEQEMWIINSPKHEYCTPTEWDEVKQSFEQVKECGWATFLAQLTQMRRARRHLQIVEPTTPDHLKKMYMDPTTGARSRIRSATKTSTLTKSSGHPSSGILLPFNN
jgi:hypothetical protein